MSDKHQKAFETGTNERLVMLELQTQALKNAIIDLARLVGTLEKRSPPLTLEEYYSDELPF